MTLRQEDTGERKYEVNKLGATESRRHGGGRQSQNDEWELNLCVRDVEAPLVHSASVTRMGISMAASFEKFIGTGVGAIS